MSEWTKEEPTKFGVYKYRHQKGGENGVIEEFQVKLKEKTKDGKLFFVEDPRLIKGPFDYATLNMYHDMGTNVEWLFVRDLDPQTGN